MTFKSNNADASFYYHEDATADVARMDSSAVYGNLADAMKNATEKWFPSPKIIKTIMLSSPTENNNKLGMPPTHTVKRQEDVREGRKGSTEDFIHR